MKFKHIIRKAAALLIYLSIGLSIVSCGKSSDSSS